MWDGTKQKRLCAGSEGRPGSAVFSRPEHVGCTTSQGPEGHCGNPSGNKGVNAKNMPHSLAVKIDTIRGRETNVSE